MTIEACNSYNDDEMYTRRVEFSVQTTWNHHQVDTKHGDNLSGLVRGYPIQGWGEMKNQIKPMDVGGKVEATIEWNWGGKDGSTVSGSIAGSLNDDKGNYLEVTATQDSNGQGNAEITVGHEEGDENK